MAEFRDDVPLMTVSGSAQGRLALMLVNTWRNGAGLKSAMWMEFPRDVQIVWWDSAGEMLNIVIDTARLKALAADVRATLEDLAAEDTESLEKAFRALLL